ncbi:hypothetical protein SALBM311S_09609 [Streptomyces alboniger]
MRHPPRSVLLAVTGAVALLGSVTVPAVTASGAVPACTVDYSVTSQWDTGFQGDVKITNNTAAVSGWNLTFDLAGGQKVSQGWNAKWSQSGTTVTVANESYNGQLGSGASVSAGFIASRSGGDAVPTTFKLNGTICNADSGPTDPTDPTDPPDPGDGTAPVLRVSGNKLVDAAGTTRRMLGVNRSGRRVHVRAGAGHLGRPGRRRLGQGDRRLEGRHRPYPAQRGVLAGPFQHPTAVRRRQLRQRGEGPGGEGQGERHDADARTAHGRTASTPATRPAAPTRTPRSARSRCPTCSTHPPSGRRWRTPSRTTRPWCSTCSTSPTRTARPLRPPRRAAPADGGTRSRPARRS